MIETGLTVIFTAAGAAAGFFGSSFTMSEKGLLVGTLIGAAAGFGISTLINNAVFDESVQVETPAEAIRVCTDLKPEDESVVIVTSDVSGTPICSYQ